MLTKIAFAMMPLLMPSHKPQPIPYYPVAPVDESMSRVAMVSTVTPAGPSYMDRGFEIKLLPVFHLPSTDANLPFMQDVDPCFSALPLVGQSVDPWTDDPTDLGPGRRIHTEPFNPGPPPFNPNPYVDGPWS